MGELESKDDVGKKARSSVAKAQASSSVVFSDGGVVPKVDVK